MRGYLGILTLAMAVVGVQAQVGVQIPDPPRSVDGHLFVPNSYVRGPFIQSSFGSTLGVESTVNLELPRLPVLPDSLKGVEGNLVFVTLGFNYEQRVKDWIGFYLNFHVAVRSGTELRTLLFEGVNTVTGGESGVLFRILKSPKSMLSGKVFINNYTATLINIRKFLEDFIDGKPDPSISESAPALAVGIGATLAHAISTVTGLTAISEISFGESLARGEQAARFRLGSALDFDWASKGVPVGVSVSYVLRSTADYVYVDKELAHTFTFKLAYTAAPQFALGLELSNSFAPVISLDEKVNTLGGQLHMQYYFN